MFIFREGKNTFFFNPCYFLHFLHPKDKRTVMKQIIATILIQARSSSKFCVRDLGGRTVPVHRFVSFIDNTSLHSVFEPRMNEVSPGTIRRTAVSPELSCPFRLLHEVAEPQVRHDDHQCPTLGSVGYCDARKRRPLKLEVNKRL